MSCYFLAPTLCNSNYTSWKCTRYEAPHYFASSYLLVVFSSAPCSQIPSVYVPPLMSGTKFHTHINHKQNCSFVIKIINIELIQNYFGFIRSLIKFLDCSIVPILPAASWPWDWFSLKQIRVSGISLGLRAAKRKADIVTAICEPTV
jgi:hypothetical protein